MKSTKVYKMVLDDNGIKSSTISKALDMSMSSVSGILSMLKIRNKVYNDDGLWYINIHTSLVKSIKLELLDLPAEDINTKWCNGYITGLHDMKFINDYEFNHLLVWLKKVY